MLEVHDLCISIPGRKIVENISFTLEKGKTLGIVGESGSGKSITALSLLGLLPPGFEIQSGSAQFSMSMGKCVELFHLNKQELLQIRGKKISMIFQEPLTCLNPSMLCGKQLKEAVENNTTLSGKKAEQRCMELLSEMQLSDPLKIYFSYPHQISGGQKQRVMIAIALAGNPEILIADEPTTALDVTVQKELLILLKQLQEKYQMGMLFISHDLGVISEIADEVMVMKDGQIIEHGSLDNVFQNPKNIYTKALIASRPSLEHNSIRLTSVEDYINGIKSKVKVTTRQTLIIRSKPLFIADNLDVSYITRRNLWGKPIEHFNALKKISFTLFEGETLGLVGESGSGKTTLGRTLVRLIDNPSGAILYKGNDLQRMDREQLHQFRKEVQYVFQDPYSSLNPMLTIGHILLEPLITNNIYSNQKERKVKVLELLERVKLPQDSFYRYPHEFSGGQRQRIVIARALTLNPKVIICDEIVSALDVSVQAQILNLLDDLKEQMNLTLLFISHDLAVVHYFCNRTMVIQNGLLVEMDSSENVFTNPQSPYTRNLIYSIPGLNRSED